MGTTSSAPPPKPKYFRADRPFLYVIRDSKTASVLFMGRLSEPFWGSDSQFERVVW